jgi:hypothetical protein
MSKKFVYLRSPPTDFYLPTYQPTYQLPTYLLAPTGGQLTWPDIARLAARHDVRLPGRQLQWQDNTNLKETEHHGADVEKNKDLYVRSYACHQCNYLVDMQKRKQRH